jgi:acyl-CoA-dependent ceramide synthase
MVNPLLPPSQQLAKLFRYLRFPTLTDLTFVVFLISWLITRQIGFSLVTLSCIFRARYILPRGWHPDKGQYANAWVINGFPALLVVLLIMNCIWFWMACNVAWRVVMGLGAEDTRSDDEE